jgi:transposase
MEDQNKSVVELYRYEKYNDSWEGMFIAKLVVRTHDVIRETPLSYIIRKPGYNKTSAISKTGKKRFAYPTKQEALQACLHRTQRAIRIQATFLERQKDYLEEIKKQIQKSTE